MSAGDEPLGWFCPSSCTLCNGRAAQSARPWQIGALSGRLGKIRALSTAAWGPLALGERSLQAKPQLPHRVRVTDWEGRSPLPMSLRQFSPKPEQPDEVRRN